MEQGESPVMAVIAANLAVTAKVAPAGIGHSMSEDFFRQPILNSPYDYPSRHWELDSARQPTQNVAASRRRADFITPILKPKKHKAGQSELRLEDDLGLSTARQQYDLTVQR